MSLDSFHGVVLPFVFTVETKENNWNGDFEKKVFVLSIDTGLVLLACNQVRRTLRRGNEDKACVLLF